MIFVEITWIIMGVWGGVSFVRELGGVLRFWIDERNYWKKRSLSVTEENNKLRLQIINLEAMLDVIP